MKSLIVIPTYNEKNNIQELIPAILNLQRGFHILIVDDNSPDGTGEIVDKLSNIYKDVHIIHRKGKLGLGTAYVEGFKYGLKNGYDYIFEMDADFSHHPKYLPDFLKAIEENDIVLGSRYVNGVSVINWGFGRLLLSKGASMYVKVVTGLPVTDATGGFKCFRRIVLEAIDLDEIHSNGYSFQIEMTYRAYRKNFRIKETPIIFEDRRVGQSKMNKKIVMEALWMPWRIQIEYFLMRFTTPFNKVITSHIGRQFLKFGFVGFIGFLVNVSIFYLANSLLNINYIICSVLAFGVAVTTNFFLNKEWTFRDFEKENIFNKYFKYFMTNIAGLLVNLAVLIGLTKLFGIKALISQMVGIVSATMVNFIGTRIWVFRIKK